MPRLMILVLTALLTLAGVADADAASKKKRKKKRATPPARVLIYSGTIGFRHNSIPHGNAMVARLGRLTGKWTTRVIEKPAELTAERLAATDVVLWHSTTGAESPFTDAQQDAYMKWVGCGGAHAGVHASTDSYKDWEGWKELTGAFFKIHPITPGTLTDDSDPHYEGNGQPEASILVKDGTSPLTSPWHGKDSFLIHDELYAFDSDPSKVIADFRPLLAFGGFTDPADAAAWSSQYADEQPLSWTGSYRGRNRIFYTNLGHSGSTWNRPDFQDALIEGLKFVGAKRPSKTCLRKENIR